MPPKFKFTREEIIQAALDLTRESGFSACLRIWKKYKTKS